MKKIMFCVVIMAVCIINQASAKSLEVACYNGACSARGTGCWAVASIAIPNALKADANYSKTKGLSMTFKEENMIAEDIRRFANRNYNENTNVILNDQLCLALGAPKGFTIGKGEYKIVKEGRTYLVDFGLGIQNSGGEYEEVSFSFAKIDLVNADGRIGCSTVADKGGNFNFPSIPNGTWKVQVSKTTGKLPKVGWMQINEIGDMICCYPGPPCEEEPFTLNVGAEPTVRLKKGQFFLNKAPNYRGNIKIK